MAMTRSYRKTDTPKSWNGAKWIRRSTRYAIYARDGWRCAYCGAHGGSLGEGLTLDHVRPRSRGGSDRPANLVTVCLGCNSSRQDETVAEFVERCVARPEQREEVLHRIERLRRRSVDRWRPLGRSVDALRRQLRQAERDGADAEALAARRAIVELLEAAGLPCRLADQDA